MATRKLLVIGQNLDGFWSWSCKTSRKINTLPNQSITEEVACLDYFIYCYHDLTKLWCAGNNQYGQLGIDKTDVIKSMPITHFLQNNINIRKVCQNTCGYCTFCISDTGNLYGCGDNQTCKNGINSDNDNITEPKHIPKLQKVIDA